MAKRELVAAYEDEDGEGVYHIVDRGEAQFFDRSELLPPDIPLEIWAETGDHDAENRNNHDFVGAHRILAALLFREVGRDAATHIMKEIIEYGGLDGMNGCGRFEEVTFADLGLKDVNGEWSLANEH